MPYITQGQRPSLDALLEPILRELLFAPEERLDGEVNYIITRILHDSYRPSYFDFNRALGVLEAAKLEFYRRRVAPYEDAKALENGDVP